MFRTRDPDFWRDTEFTQSYSYLACEIFSALGALGIRQEHYVIVGGAALAIFGIRHRVEDIDLVVDPRLIDKIVRTETKVHTRTARYGGAMPYAMPGEILRLGAAGLVDQRSAEAYRSDRYAELEYGPIDLMRKLPCSAFEDDFEGLYPFTQDVAGFNVLTPDAVLLTKQGSDREKDTLDVWDIEEYLKKQYAGVPTTASLLPQLHD